MKVESGRSSRLLEQAPYRNILLMSRTRCGGIREGTVSYTDKRHFLNAPSHSPSIFLIDPVSQVIEM